jgi:hypothetical protein
MADFVTPNLAYTEPENGGSVNTWGVKLNENIRKQDLDVSARVLRAGDVMSGALGVVAGTEAAPGVFISGDTNSGFYSPAADMVGIATGGVGRFILSNTLLSLAVGLTVAGVTALAGVTVSGNAVLGDAAGDTVTVNGALSYTHTLTGGTGIVNIGSGQIYKDASGNVVLGGTTPSGTAALTVSKATSVTQVVLDTSSVAANLGGGLYMGGLYDTGLTTTWANIRGYKLNATLGDFAGGLVLGTRLNGGSLTDRLWIDPPGNLGLGVTPSAWGSNYKAIESAGNAQFAISAANVNGLSLVSNAFNDNTNWIYKTTGSASRYSVDGGQHRFFTAPSGTAGNVITFGDPKMILLGGNLLLGTTTDFSSVTRAYFVGDTATASNALGMKVSDAAGFTTFTWNASTTGDSKFIEFATEGSYTARGSVDYNRAGGLTRFNTTSDKTLKTLIGDAPQEKSLSILRETHLREYYWNDDPTEKPQIGPFAQELHQTYPGAVSVGGFYDEVVPAVTEQVLVLEGVDEVTDEEGNVLIPAQDPVYETVVIEPEHTVQKYRPWGVDKTAFSFHLVAGFQYLDQQVSDHQQRFEALEARLAALEAA